MRKMAFCLAVVVLMAGVSAQAQKKSLQPISSPPVVEPTSILIQDDSGGGFISISLVSGEYKVYLCEYGYELSGVGEVKIDGCSVYFSIIEKRYRVFATVNMCDHSASSAVEIFGIAPVGFDIEPILEYWTDKDMNGSTTDCGGLAVKK